MERAMTQQNKVEFDPTQWYQLWMKQSQDFFQTAEANLKDIFEKQASHEMQQKQMQAWLDAMKKQWEFSSLTPEQQQYQAYWQNMIKLCNEAGEMLLKEWTRRVQENQPINSVRDLYETWLNCCGSVYKKNLQTPDYQAMYGQMMGAAFEFWKKSMPK